MIPNPIYEGPLYETIPPQTFDSLAAKLDVENDSSQEREVCIIFHFHKVKVQCQNRIAESNSKYPLIGIIYEDKHMI